MSKCVVRVQKSRCIVIPKPICEALDIKKGDKVHVKIVRVKSAYT